MLKRSFILITVVGTSILFANQPETVRESTVIYELKEGATAAELRGFNALMNRNTIIEEKEIKGLQIKVVKVKNIKGLEKSFSRKLMSTGAVRFAEPDAIIPHAVTPNDTDYSSQWHHTTINSPLAWDHTTGSDGLDTVKVCVLDTGVDSDHPDLVGNLVLPGYNAELEVVGNIEDAHGHGTGTSGVVGAVGNNNVGVSGMAWDMNIIPVQINISDTNSNAYLSTMARGITWCADQGGKVANLSYGGAQYTTIDTAAQYLRDAGGLLVMAAGNSGAYHDSATFPDYTSFVIVGATDQSDTKTSWSEYGPYVDVTAPGLSIGTTYLNGGYINYSGTSFSSPMTAGLAALIYTINPNFTPAEVESFIFSTAVDLGIVGDDDTYGHGRIDAGAAIVAAVDSFGTPNIPPVAVADSNTTSGYAPLSVAFNGSASSDEDGTIVSYLWNFGDGNTASGVTAIHTYATDGAFTATLTVTDNGAVQTTSSPITIVVNPVPNISPVAVATADTTIGTAPLAVTFDGSTSTDEDGTIASYLWNFGDGNTANGVTAIHTYDTAGSFNATLTVTDDRGAQATSAQIAIEITPSLSTVNAPTDLTALVDTNSVNLSWIDNSSNETGFDIYRALKIRGKYDYSLLATTVNNTYTDTNMDLGDYRYKTQAKSLYNGGEIYSDFSNEVSVKIETSVSVTPDPVTLSAPVLSATISGSEVTLAWSHDCPTGSTCSYLIERGDTKVRAAINFSQIASVNTLSYIVTESAGTYYYRVYAADNVDQSAFSNTVTARLK